MYTYYPVFQSQFLADFWQIDCKLRFLDFGLEWCCLGKPLWTICRPPQDAVKCNLMELTTWSTSLTSTVSSLLYMRMRQDSSCSWSIGHCGIWMVFLSAFEALAFLLSMGTPWRMSPLPCPSFSFHCLISVTGACFFPSARGLIAGLPGFASHGSGLHLGAGCQ